MFYGIVNIAGGALVLVVTCLRGRAMLGLRLEKCIVRYIVGKFVRACRILRKGK